MKLFIPELGTELQLTTDWHFSLYPESRNDTLAHIQGYYWYSTRINGKYEEVFIPLDVEIPQYGDDHANREAWRVFNDQKEEWFKEKIEDGTIIKDVLPVRIPRGSKLVVDRIYIRKGAKDFSSISFFLKGHEKVKTLPRHSWHQPQTRPVRFWAKLDDCNTINYKIPEE